MWSAMASALFGAVLSLLLRSGRAQDNNASTMLVPAIFTFGDSAADAGNNDYLPMIIKANYPSYGRDFVDRKATGRLCNGKLATDIAAETSGFMTYPLPYLSPDPSSDKLLIGASFASAASGYNKRAAAMNINVRSRYQSSYIVYQGKLVNVAGRENGVYLVSAGTGNFLHNYYLNPFLNELCTPEQYGSFILGSFTSFIQGLYILGARKIGVTSLPSIGCFPVAVTLLGYGQNGCVSRVNADVRGFNERLNSAAMVLWKQMCLTPGLFWTHGDKPMNDLSVPELNQSASSYWKERPNSRLSQIEKTN